MYSKSFIAIANDQAFRRWKGRQCDQEFSFTSGFEPVIEAFAEPSDFGNHLTLLINLDWKNATILTLVIGLGDGGCKSLVELRNAVID